MDVAEHVEGERDSASARRASRASSTPRVASRSRCRRPKGLRRPTRRARANGPPPRAERFALEGAQRCLEQWCAGRVSLGDLDRQPLEEKIRSVPATVAAGDPRAASLTLTRSRAAGQRAGKPRRGQCVEVCRARELRVDCFEFAGGPEQQQGASLPRLDANAICAAQQVYLARWTASGSPASAMSRSASASSSAPASYVICAAARARSCATAGDRASARRRAPGRRRPRPDRRVPGRDPPLARAPPRQPRPGRLSPRPGARRDDRDRPARRSPRQGPMHPPPLFGDAAR